MTAEALKGHLEVLLLSTLARGGMHGYAVAEALRTRSDGVFDLPEGTLYPALHRLEAAGLVASRWAVVSGRRRRVYQLSIRGRRALDDRRAAWRTFAAGMRAVVEA
jgi:DNA-binding PadR family transcriptional regulator